LRDLTATDETNAYNQYNVVWCTSWLG